MTTMASSMRMPIDSDNASMVIMLSVNPMAWIKANVAMTETGRAVALMSVARQSCRKNKMIKMARMAPNTRSNLTSSIASSVKTELSVATCMVTLGTSGLSFSIALFTLCATATTLAPDCLRMTKVTEDLPLNVAYDLRSWAPSSTRATSRTRTGDPPAAVMMMSPSSASV